MHVLYDIVQCTQHTCMRFPTTVAGLDSKINARFLLNEHGGLYFLFFIFCACYPLKFRKGNREINPKEKRYSWKRTQNRSVLQAANYDHENNDLKNAFCQRRFKSCDFLHKFYMILFHMLETFYLSRFLRSTLYYLNYIKLCFQLPQNVTWTDEQCV